MTERRIAFNATIHGARGLFALLVFVFHVTNSGLAGFYARNGWSSVYAFPALKFGVELFFGISGFVIVGALARAPSIRAFLWDRATRIFPLLWITLIAISAVSLMVGHWMPPLHDWLLNFLAPPPFFELPQVNPAAWSLGYEIAFYALCALCWHARSRGMRWRPIAALVGLGLVIAFPRAILMPAGVLIAAGLINGRAATRAAAAPGLWLAAFLLMWRWLELQAPADDVALLTPWHMGSGWLALVPFELGGGIFGGLTLRGMVEQRGVLSQLLRTPVFRWLGTISFSFYLWHPVVMAATKAGMIHTGLAAASGSSAQAVFALVSLPPTLAIAHVSQAWIERRLTRMLRRLGPRENRPHAPITAIAEQLPRASCDTAKAPLW